MATSDIKIGQPKPTGIHVGSRETALTSGPGITFVYNTLSVH